MDEGYNIIYGLHSCEELNQNVRKIYSDDYNDPDKSIEDTLYYIYEHYNLPNAEGAGAGAEAEETHEKLLIMNSLIELTEQNRDYKSLGVLLTYKYINPNVQHDQGDIDKDIERIMRAIGPMTLAGDIKEAFFPSEARNPPYDLIRSLPNAEQDLLIGKYETKRDNAIAAVDNTDSRMELLILLLIILGAMTPIIGIIPVIVVAVAYTLNAFPFNTLQNIETKHSNTCDRLEKEKKKRPALTFCPVRVNNPMNNSDCNRSTNAETVTPPTN